MICVLAELVCRLGDGVKKVGNRRSNSDLLQLLNTPATWVVRARSGAVGNASSLRAALEVAVPKAHVHNPLESIISVSRFDSQQVYIYRRQIRKLLERSAQTSFESDSSLMLANSGALTSMKRGPFSRLGRMFSRRGLGKSIASSRLLKKSFASTGKDGVVAVVEGQLNLDRAVVLEFG